MYELIGSISLKILPTWLESIFHQSLSFPYTVFCSKWPRVFARKGRLFYLSHWPALRSFTRDTLCSRELGCWFLLWAIACQVGEYRSFIEGNGRNGCICWTKGEAGAGRRSGSCGRVKGELAAPQKHSTPGKSSQPQEGPSQGAMRSPRRLCNGGWTENEPKRAAPTGRGAAGWGEICVNSLLLIFCFVLIWGGNEQVNRGAIFILVFIQMKPDIWAWRPLWSLWGTSFKKEPSQQLRFLTLAASPTHLSWKLPCLAFSPMCLERQGAEKLMRLSSEELGERGSKTHWKEGGRENNSYRNSLLCRKKIRCWVDVFYHDREPITCPKRWINTSNNKHKWLANSNSRCGFAFR